MTAVPCIRQNNGRLRTDWSPLKWFLQNGLSNWLIYSLSIVHSILVFLYMNYDENTYIETKGKVRVLNLFKHFRYKNNNLFSFSWYLVVFIFFCRLFISAVEDIRKFASYLSKRWDLEIHYLSIFYTKYVLYILALCPWNSAQIILPSRRLFHTQQSPESQVSEATRLQKLPPTTGVNRG